VLNAMAHTVEELKAAYVDALGSVQIIKGELHTK
jgi:hypothetical protein